MDATTRLKLEELRKEAFKRLETDKSKATVDERVSAVTVVVRSTDGTAPILRQVLRDLRIYPIYDCLAMWLDPDAGLAHYAPELMIQVATVMI